MNFVLLFCSLTTKEKEKIGSKFYKRQGNFIFKTLEKMNKAFVDLKYMNIHIPLFKNKTLNGYPLMKNIGEGKWSICYYSETKEGMPVVIKCSKKHWFFIKKISLNREVAILSKTNHPAIPKVINTFVDNGIEGYIMDFKPGVTLYDMVFKKHKKFQYDEIVDIFNKVLTVIAYLHENKILHRDIKPKNTLWNYTEISIIDFGFSSMLRENSDLYKYDFLYLGNLLLFLLYSNYEGNPNGSWIEQLNLTNEQIIFIKRLLWILPEHKHITEVQIEFQIAFPLNNVHIYDINESNYFFIGNCLKCGKQYNRELSYANDKLFCSKECEQGNLPLC